jgi:hypothetical protein
MMSKKREKEEDWYICSLLRYVPESVAREREKRILDEEAAAAKAAIAAAKGTVNETNKPEEAAEHIPRSIDSARRHASEPLHHAEVKSAGKKPLGSVVKTVVAKKNEVVYAQGHQSHSVYWGSRSTKPNHRLGLRRHHWPAFVSQTTSVGNSPLPSGG